MATKAKKKKAKMAQSMGFDNPRKPAYWPLVLGAGVGLFVGLSIFLVSNKRYSSEANHNVEIQHPSVPPKAKSLVNPVVNSKGYAILDIGEIAELEGKINVKIQGFLKSGKAKSISVYFRDLSNEDVIGINEKETFSPASLMKVPVMLSILKLADSDPQILKLKLPFYGRKESLFVGEGNMPFNTTTSLVAGQNYPIEDLLRIMTIESDNEATYLLLDYIDGNYPGFRIKSQEKLGLVLPANAVNTENFVTVRQYSSFFRTLYNASYLSPKMSELALSYLANSGFEGGIKSNTPSRMKVSHKFGFKQIDASNYQLHDFGIVYYPRKPFLLGIMTKGGNVQDIKTVIAELTKLIFSEIESHARDSNHHLDRDLI
ncbi:MAG: serine hydrolase [Flavobacteriales bacterium]|nr:serine hydrolase [Flavobacteriales bacterium]